MILYAPFNPGDDCRQSAPQRRQTNRVARLLFALTALAGRLLKYLS